jgi:two-component system cell cycle response regulator
MSASRLDPGLVLVADDSAVMRAVLRGELTSQGWEVAEARDGVEALERCRERAPQVILLDIEMPRMNGFQVLAELLRDGDLADIPVIFLTARDSGRDVAEGLRRGAHDYLRKPFESVELLARVLLAHRMKSLRDELRARNRELERLALTDPLTGLHNRRSMLRHLRAMTNLHQRHGTPLAALMLDIDHFKAVNDRHGHDAGDDVLRAVGERLGSRLRTEDAAGRWGGEEFLVLLPETSVSDAVRVAEDLRACLAAPIGALRVTTSVGVAAHSGGETPEALVKHADDALYAAKAAGRDTVRTTPAVVA